MTKNQIGMTLCIELNPQYKEEVQAWENSREIWCSASASATGLYTLRGKSIGRCIGDGIRSRGRGGKRVAVVKLSPGESCLDVNHAPR
jgi:hypothetical protein